MFFLQLRHLVLRLFYALLIHCSSLFACPLVVSHLSCATLSPFGISFLRLWSLALRCLLFSVPSAKLLLLTSLLMALPEFGILLLYCKLQCKINCVFFFFLSLVRSLSLCLLRRVPWLAPGYWTILIKQIVSIIIKFLEYSLVWSAERCVPGTADGRYRWIKAYSPYEVCRGYSSVVERSLRMWEATGSNPVTSTAVLFADTNRC